MTMQNNAALPSEITVVGLRSLLRLEFPGCPIQVSEGVSVFFVGIRIWEYEVWFSVGAKDGDLFTFRRKVTVGGQERIDILEQKPVRVWGEVNAALTDVKQHMNGILAAIETAYSI